MRFVGAICACLLSAVLAGPAGAQEAQACAASTGIGVARTIDIDTRGGPWFGAPHGNPELLAPGEVVLTFDDGPLPHTTRPILWALAAECAKATFFVVGEMAAAHPELVRELAIQGHTIGTHTWSHANLRTLPGDAAKAQIEAAFAQVEKAAGRPIAPFFRYPYLSSSQSTVAYLRSRDIAQFSVDVDSLDWRMHKAQSIVRQVMAKLDTLGRGIVLLHDIHPSTALAIPALLAQLKEKGFKIVHLRPVAPVQTLAVTQLPPRSSGPGARRRPASANDTDAKGQAGGGWLWKWPFW